jgi:hypothetical protein
MKKSKLPVELVKTFTKGKWQSKPLGLIDGNYYLDHVHDTTNEVIEFWKLK